VDKDAKNLEWKKIVEVGNGLHQNDAAKHFIERQSSLIQTFKSLYGEENVVDLSGETVSRLSIGFGDSGPLDTGLTLHRLYGLPYLPASAIKGISRARAINEAAQALDVPRLSAAEVKQQKGKTGQTPMRHLEAWLLSPRGERSEAWERLQKSMKEYVPIPNEMPEKIAQTFMGVFGSQDERGNVHFLDAFPARIPKTPFELDIINAHYQTYYESGGAKPPADYYSPVPVMFLTVAPGVTFRFVMTCKEPEFLKTAKVWLQQALLDFGIGAKTALGYGQIDTRTDRHEHVTGK
jgi:CRISPR-associated protein Cmr6